MDTNRPIRLVAGLTTALLIAMTSLPGVAQAQVGALSLWWDVCAANAIPAVHSNKVFGGPVNFAAVLSVRDADSICHGWEIGFQIATVSSPSYPDCWRFDLGGCYDEFFLGTDLPVNVQCRSFKGAQGIPTMTREFNTAASGPNRTLIRAQSAFQPFDPVPGTEYTVFQLRFDHTFVVTGPTTPGINCGGAETEMSLRVTQHKFLDSNNALVDWPVAHEQITWMAANPVPTAPSTWGRIKGSYR